MAAEPTCFLGRGFSCALEKFIEAEYCLFRRWGRLKIPCDDRSERFFAEYVAQSGRKDWLSRNEFDSLKVGFRWSEETSVSAFQSLSRKNPIQGLFDIVIISFSEATSDLL